MSGSGSSSSTTARFVVTTVSLRPCRWRASWSVDVPMSIITVWPSSTSAAAAAPSRSLTSKRSTSICENPGSRPFSTAPPWTRSSLPSRASAWRSRRTVISDTPKLSARSDTCAVPAADGAQDLLASLCGQERHRPNRTVVNRSRPTSISFERRRGGSSTRTRAAGAGTTGPDRPCRSRARRGSSSRSGRRRPRNPGR